MAYNIARTREEGRAQLQELANAFAQGHTSFMNRTYNETQVRNDFINPFLMSLGWDVYNEAGKPQPLRDVIQEEAIDIADQQAKRNPDYTLKVQGERKLFVEAKKPSIDITGSAATAFQVRRYGWNANLGISILTNFETLVVYDCRHRPHAQDNERIARVRIINFQEYSTAFDEIYDLISYEAAYTGRIDDLFSVYDRAGETFDDYFLQQIEGWRAQLATSAVQRNEYLRSEDINFLIQRLLNRIVFLRICEDRNIEQYETLRNIRDYDELKALFQQSDRKYNSGLFNFIEDTLSLNIEIDAAVLIGIFNELYYPLSPYDFSVVDPTILSQIYEKFLGNHLVLDEHRQLSIVSEPEVVASNGVVPTPKLIVGQIVQETLRPLIAERNARQLATLKIADICCGSGTFLISVYDLLLQSTLSKLHEEQQIDSGFVHMLPDGSYALTLRGKRNILEQNIYGVDINPYAIEVTEFSLLLKLLEGENAASIDSFISQYANRVLPSLRDNIKCGNSLVDDRFFDFMPEALENDRILFQVKPFNWLEEFPFLKETGGFDAIVGNPPYVRIQNLVRYAPEEVKYYQHKEYGFVVARNATIDKYYVFIQRAIELLNPTGLLGYIIPHKFFINRGGKALRKFIREACSISSIIHFGVAQVFPDRSTYTAILILQKSPAEQFTFKRVRKITPETLSPGHGFTSYEQDTLSDEPWIFLSRRTEAVFQRLKSGNNVPLKELADICVGLQTSADKIYIFEPEGETEQTYLFTRDGIGWEIEKDICLPCIYDLSFEAFDTIQANARIIFPYHIEEGKAVLFPEEYFSEYDPLCWAYLNAHKETLERRSLQGRDPRWYEFGRSQSLTRFHSSSKLIWPVLSTRPAYIYDVSNIQFTGGGNGPYYSLVNNSGYSILYFMAILAHPLFESMVKAGASEFRGAYYSHGKQFIENLPIRIIKEDNAEEEELYTGIIATTEELIRTKSQHTHGYGPERIILERKLSTLSGRLITMINTLYGISWEEYETVLSDEMLTTELTTTEE